MRHRRGFITLLLMTAAAFWVMTGSAWAIVAGGYHDLSIAGVQTSVNFTLGFVCQPCHAPHNNVTLPTDAAGGPLWSHTLNASFPATNPYTGYSSDTFSASPGGTPPTIGALDVLCLSCHDGTVALSAFQGSVDTATTTTVTGAANLGVNLSNDHPTSFALPTTETGIATASVITGAGFVLYGTSNNVQCGTCHDPHATNTTGNNFLRVALSSSFCTTCHTNK